MTLPLFYEIGRCAAFSAADAHRDMPEVDITSAATMTAAYGVTIEANEDGAYSDLAATITPADAHWPQFAEGYRDALYELKWTPPALAHIDGIVEMWVRAGRCIEMTNLGDTELIGRLMAVGWSRADAREACARLQRAAFGPTEGGR